MALSIIIMVNDVYIGGGQGPEIRVVNQRVVQNPFGYTKNFSLMYSIILVTLLEF